LLAWAVRHGEVAGRQAVDWIIASPGAPDLGHAAALWPVLEKEERRRLWAVVNEPLSGAPLPDLGAWMAALTAHDGTGEAEALAQALLHGSRAQETASVWALALSPRAWSEALIIASTGREEAVLLLAQRVAASSFDMTWPASSLRALLDLGEKHVVEGEHDSAPAPALGNEPGALAPQLLAELRALTVAHLPAALLENLISACEATAAVAPEPTFRALLGAWSRVPSPPDAPHESLRRAHEVLVRAATTGPACLAAVSPNVPDALVDEAVRLQRQAQSPQRPAALAALAARTSHPAVRRRLFLEAYHETRFRRDPAQLRRVIAIAAPVLPEEASAWLAELPDDPDTCALVATLLAQPSALSLAPLVARVRAVHKKEAPLPPALLVHLVAATPVSLAEVWIDAAPADEPMRTLFWQVLAPKLPPARLATLLAEDGAWDLIGPRRWWTTSLVELAPPELVRARVADGAPFSP